MALRQVAPGRYEAKLVADASSRSASACGTGNGDTAGVGSRVILPDPAAEYRFGPPDEEGLSAIARATGGAWRPGPEALASVAGDRTDRAPPDVAVLVAAALGLWFVDLLLRRIRVLEPSVERATAIERL